MNIWLTHPYLRDVRHGADYVDIKTNTGQATLQHVVAGVFSYHPGWLRGLYIARLSVAAALGLGSVGMPPLREFSVDEVPVEPGAPFSFLTVEHADDAVWAGVIRDRHLDVWIVCTRESQSSGRASRFTLGTVVRHHGWSGRFYLGLIGPFHHIIVRRMLAHAVHRAESGSLRNE